jgi:hypothetical protein
MDEDSRTRLTRKEALVTQLEAMGLVVCTWSSSEVQELRPKWSEERVQKELKAIATELVERVQESGWDALDEMLPGRRVGDSKTR